MALCRTVGEKQSRARGWCWFAASASWEHLGGLSVQPCACSSFTAWLMFSLSCRVCLTKCNFVARGVFDCARLWNQSLSRLCTDVHGGGEVSWAVHLLGAGVRPGLSGSAPLPGTRGDPDRRQRSCTCQTVLTANICHIGRLTKEGRRQSSRGRSRTGKTGPYQMYQMLSHFRDLSICVLANYSGSHYSDQYTAALIFCSMTCSLEDSVPPGKHSTKLWIPLSFYFIFFME